MHVLAVVSLFASFLFAGIPWDTPAQTVVKDLKDAGFAVARKPDHGDYRFHGALLGREAVGVASMSDAKLVRVVVVMSMGEDSVRDTYDQVRELLVKKYGAPSKTVKQFLEPFHEGDGYEQEAIRAGKAVFATEWNDSGQTLVVNITPDLTVAVSYESPEWAAEAARRMKKSF